MAITTIEMTGPTANLSAKITPKENVILGLSSGNKSSGVVLKHDKFVNSEEIKLSENFLRKIKKYGLEERLEQMMIYLKKIMVK